MTIYGLICHFSQGVHEEVRKINKTTLSSSTPPPASTNGTTTSAPASEESSVPTTASARAGLEAKPAAAKPVIKKAVVIRAVKARAPATDQPKEKGEVMEQNQDGLEYSEEEEEMDIHEQNEKLAMKGKKEMIKIDHNKIVYQDFRKNFWVEVPELKAMTDAEVEAYRAELEGVKVRGKEVPKPIKAWSQAGLSKKVREWRGGLCGGGRPV